MAPLDDRERDDRVRDGRAREYRFLDGVLTFGAAAPLAPSQDGYLPEDRLAVAGVLAGGDANPHGGHLPGEPSSARSGMRRRSRPGERRGPGPEHRSGPRPADQSAGPDHHRRTAGPAHGRDSGAGRLPAPAVAGAIHGSGSISRGRSGPNPPGRPARKLRPDSGHHHEGRRRQRRDRAGVGGPGHRIRRVPRSEGRALRRITGPAWATSWIDAQPV